VTTLVLAVLGVFPFGALYVFPILAAVTLRSAFRWLRICVLTLSVFLLPITAVVDLAKR
jgi:hypothetical protein